MAIESVKRAI